MNTQQQQMLRDIETEIALTSADTGLKSFSKRVMQAIANVPRHQKLSLRSHLYL